MSWTVIKLMTAGIWAAALLGYAAGCVILITDLIADLIRRRKRN